MKTAIIKTMSKNEKSSAQCFHSVRAPILESPKGNLKSSSPSKSSCDKVLSNVVQSSLIIIDKTDLEIIVVPTESSNSYDVRNTSRNTNTKDIKKFFVLGDSMVKHVPR